MLQLRCPKREAISKTLCSASIGVVAVVCMALLAVPGAYAQIAYDPFEEVVGVAQVEEGDVLAVGGQPVRLYGIDAPELGQMCSTRRGVRFDCGEAARSILERLIGTAEVSCSVYAGLSDGRSVGRCFVGGADLGLAMVSRGWAYTLPSLSNRYGGAQAEAQARRAGLWSARAQRPWVWRNEQRLSDTAVDR